MSNQPLCESCNEPMEMGTFEHQPLRPMGNDDPYQPLTVKFWFECWYCNTETSIEEDYYVVPKTEMETKREGWTVTRGKPSSYIGDDLGLLIDEDEGE